MVQRVASTRPLEAHAGLRTNWQGDPIRWPKGGTHLASTYPVSVRPCSSDSDAGSGCEMNKALWIAVAISFVFLAVVILLIASAPTEADKQQLINTALAAQEAAGLAAEIVDLALLRHEEAWFLVEQGPQHDAQIKLAEADKYGNADIVRPQVLRELHSHPLYISARNATVHYNMARASYREADAAAVKALEAVMAAGLWDRYEAAHEG